MLTAVLLCLSVLVLVGAYRSRRVRTGDDWKLWQERMTMILNERLGERRQHPVVPSG